MMENERMGESLNRLLSIARTDAAVLREDIAEIEEARRAAETSLAGLESDGAGSGEGFRMRRHRLHMTVLTLSDAENAARERLDAAFVEMQKLERLMADKSVIAQQHAPGAEAARASG